MAYLKPPAFTRKVFNPLAVHFGIGGARALTISGRTSGQPHTVPVIPVEHGGATYVVSARGETEWVRNLRVAGACDLAEKGATRHYGAVEVPENERADVIAAYRKVAGRTVATYWKTLPEPADHPVFRLTSA